ncbi:MAG: molybdopterin-guanine dinucleotide biosynthesis protein B [Synergistetes bacterium]|nr:molybdopterin-guanine dinucleotide biosynthesis protein B [Synergistota bacterium]MDW8192949.1 molybdopterin-guanine dinucleotide biosynthesis protein B [Synergistota bacterium]
MAIKSCFSVVGYHNSGKTTLISRMIPLIREKGFTVSTIKHAKSLSFKDSDILFQSGSEETIAVADGFSLMYFKLFDLGLLIDLIKSDILVIEGFKKGPFPKIVKGRNLGEVEGLVDELTLALVLDEVKDRDFNGIPVFLSEEIKDIVDLALNKSFPPLPLLNCGGCGFKDCYDMAKAIFMGERKYSDCVALPSKVILKVNGFRIPLKPFVEEIFMVVNAALVNTLKSRPEGIKEIELNIRL